LGSGRIGRVFSCRSTRPFLFPSDFLSARSSGRRSQLPILGD
jgi:hypothetical protein